MTALAHRTSLQEILALSRLRSTESDHPARLRLVLRGDGWSLLDPGGASVFHAPGPGGRRRCLEFARDHGVVAISA